MDKYKEIIKGIIIVVLYYISPTLFIMPFIMLLVPNISFGYLYLILYFILALIFSFIYYKDLIHDFKDFKDFKKNYKKYLKVAFKYWLKGLFIMIVCAIIFNFIGIEQNVNESSNQTLLKEYPLIEIIISIFLAPLTEELVFRRGLKNISSNIHIYSYISGIIFALLHLITSLNNPIMLLYIIPYSAVGIAFGYTYKRNNNIYSSICIHSLHNIITLLQLILLGGI